MKYILSGSGSPERHTYTPFVFYEPITCQVHLLRFFNLLSLLVNFTYKSHYYEEKETTTRYRIPTRMSHL